MRKRRKIDEQTRDTIVSIFVSKYVHGSLHINRYLLLSSPVSFIFAITTEAFLLLLLSIFYVFFLPVGIRSGERISRKIARQKSETKPILKPRALLSLRITTANRYTTRRRKRYTCFNIRRASVLFFSLPCHPLGNFVPFTPWVSSLRKVARPI